MYTVENVMATNPCYSEERIRNLFGTKKTLSLKQIAKRKDVPGSDRIWLLCELEPEIAVDFAFYCAGCAERFNNNYADDAVVAAADFSDADAAARAAASAAAYAAEAAVAVAAAFAAAEREIQCDWWAAL